jgi:hypothetical protein
LIDDLRRMRPAAAHGKSAKGKLASRKLADRKRASGIGLCFCSGVYQ